MKTPELPDARKGHSTPCGGSAPEREGVVALDFMVDPVRLAELLARGAIADPVRCKIIDPAAIFLTGILGESGRRLVNDGIEFYFTRKLATKLITTGIAVEAQRPSSAAGWGEERQRT